MREGDLIAIADMYFESIDNRRVDQVQYALHLGGPASLEDVEL